MEVNWTEIFERRPDLEPPGYRETVEALKNAPRRERRRTSAKKNAQAKPNRFPSAKHAVNDD